MQLLSADLLHHTEHVAAVQIMDAAHHHHGDALGTAQTTGGTHQDAKQFQSVCVLKQHWLVFIISFALIIHMFRTKSFPMAILPCLVCQHELW